MTPAVSHRQPALSDDEILVTGEYPLARRDLKRIVAMIYEDAGIHMTEAKASLVYSRLAKRVRRLGLKGFSAYCELASSPEGAAERREMMSALTTNFTRFFRENHHFEHLAASVLPDLVQRARAGGRVRIWSAGCSDGQEPYSIALTVLKAMPDAAQHDVRILATDIDPKILALAVAGAYDDGAIDTVPAPMRKQFFRDRGAGAQRRWQVDDAVKRLITYRELNLMGDWPFKGPFDVIFCRNVVIYFNEATQAVIWGRYADKLAPGGHLFIGHSERVSGPSKDRFDNAGITTYRLRQTAGGLKR